MKLLDTHSLNSKTLATSGLPSSQPPLPSRQNLDSSHAPPDPVPRSSSPSPPTPPFFSRAAVVQIRLRRPSARPPPPGPASSSRPGAALSVFVAPKRHLLLDSLLNAGSTPSVFVAPRRHLRRSASPPPPQAPPPPTGLPPAVGCSVRPHSGEGLGASPTRSTEQAPPHTTSPSSSLRRLASDSHGEASS